MTAGDTGNHGDGSSSAPATTGGATVGSTSSLSATSVMQSPLIMPARPDVAVSEMPPGSSVSGSKGPGALASHTTEARYLWLPAGGNSRRMRAAPASTRATRNVPRPVNASVYVVSGSSQSSGCSQQSTPSRQ